MLERHVDRTCPPEPKHAAELCHDIADAIDTSLPREWRLRGSAHYSDRLEHLMERLRASTPARFEGSMDLLVELLSELYDWAERSRISLA